MLFDVLFEVTKFGYAEPSPPVHAGRAPCRCNLRFSSARQCHDRRRSAENAPHSVARAPWSTPSWHVSALRGYRICESFQLRNALQPPISVTISRLQHHDLEWDVFQSNAEFRIQFVTMFEIDRRPHRRSASLPSGWIHHAVHRSVVTSAFRRSSAACSSIFNCA